MPVKILIMLAAVGLTAGCANESTQAPFAGQSSFAAASMLGGPAAAAALQDADLQRAAKQTVAGKMLAAIALQRVTGRTADPSRFSELR